jgi:hypothetical protein
VAGVWALGSGAPSATHSVAVQAAATRLGVSRRRHREADRAVVTEHRQRLIDAR